MSKPENRSLLHTLSDAVPETAPRSVVEVVAEATGRGHRTDPVLRVTGGPAGNARATAWTGLALLVLVAVEVVTLLDVHGLITWHVVVGTVLVPVALLKTCTTGWRIVRYYTGNRHYRAAGPPPIMLRVLGPLVVFTTLGVLGTGLALIAEGASAGRQPFVTLAGYGVDVLMLHKAFFIVFAVATGLHILGRLVPATVLATGRLQQPGDDRAQVAGGVARAAMLVLALVAGVLAAVVVVGASSSWQHGFGHGLH